VDSRSIATDFGVLAARVRSTHIHEQLRDRDSHLWPGTETNGRALIGTSSFRCCVPRHNRPPLLLEIEGEDGREARLSKDNSGYIRAVR